jgi:phosphonate transport system substrate-binding protein|tara:strand:+ start:183 stop:1121 length:939 start_codon:yes stop_codon:yes gene_type:complete
MLLRHSLLNAVVAGLFGAAALSASTASADDYIGGWQKDFPVVNYGVISIETATDNLKSQKKFVDYASKELGVQFKLFTAAEYSGIMNGLVAGQVQVGWLGASSYASVWQNCKCVEPIAGAQDVSGGMGYNSVMIVKTDSPYQKYEDLKGKTVARNDANSTSGFTIPTYSWAQMGTPIDEYFNSPLSGGHQQTVTGVLNGTFDAGFTWTTVNDGFGALRKMIDKGMLKRKDIRVIWTSPLIPTPPVVIMSSLPQAMKTDLIKLFLRLEENDPKVAEAVAQGKTLGMQRVYHEDYVTVMEAKKWLKANRKKKKS